MRKPIIAGNWKMNMSVEETQDFVKTLKNYSFANDVEAVLCAPSTLLHTLRVATTGTDIKRGAQNMHFEEKGAFTGEISPSMLTEMEVEYVILGHSERRQFFHETDEMVNNKILKALEYNLKPILCCGETLAEREAGETKNVVKVQVEKGLEGVSVSDLGNVVIAYEPIWAIGTGKTATSDDANDVIKYIRGVVAESFGQAAADGVRLQYGGSVTPSNVTEIMNQSDIDGALVGGASLQVASFRDLLQF